MRAFRGILFSAESWQCGAPNSGETVVGMKFTTAPGSKGANQAVQCARLGAEVTMVSKVDDDAFGRIMTETAAAAGMDVSHVLVDPQEASGVGHITLEVSDHGAQNRITVCPGVNFTLTVEEVSWLKEEIGKYDLVMMQFELPMEVIEAVAQWAPHTWFTPPLLKSKPTTNNPSVLSAPQAALLFAQNTAFIFVQNIQTPGKFVQDAKK